MRRLVAIILAWTLASGPLQADVVDLKGMTWYASFKARQANHIDGLVTGLVYDKATRDQLMALINKHKSRGLKLPQVAAIKSGLEVGGIEFDFSLLRKGIVLVNHRSVETKGKAVESLFNSIKSLSGTPTAGTFSLFESQASASGVLGALAGTALVVFIIQQFTKCGSGEVGAVGVPGPYCIFKSQDDILRNAFGELKLRKFDCREGRIVRLAYTGEFQNDIEFVYEKSRGTLEALQSLRCKYSVNSERKIIEASGQGCTGRPGDVYDRADINVPFDRLSSCCAAPDCVSQMQNLVRSNQVTASEADQTGATSVEQ